MISPTETAPKPVERATSPPPAAPSTDYSEFHRTEPGSGRRSAEVKRQVNGLVDDLRHWFRQEVRLARVETMNGVHELTRQAGNAVAGGAVVFLGAVLMLFAAGFGIGALFLLLEWNLAASLAASFFIVSVITLLIGWASITVARRRLSFDHLKPERTLRSLHNAKDTAKEKMS